MDPWSQKGNFYGSSSFTPFMEMSKIFFANSTSLRFKAAHDYELTGGVPYQSLGVLTQSQPTYSQSESAQCGSGYQSHDGHKGTPDHNSTQ